MTGTFLSDKTSKNAQIKREILRKCILNGNSSIAEFSRDLSISVPTATKLVGELIAEGFVRDEGKVGTSGGRRPSIFGLDPDAGFFVGVDVARHHFHIAVTDFKGGLVDFLQDIEFVLEADVASFRSMCRLIIDKVTGLGIPWIKVLGVGVSLSGRVNPEMGYSLTYFVSEDIPLTAELEKELRVPVTIENDSRAMAYAEFMTRPDADRNMVCINLSWGLGMGMVLDGRLYYGKSGFSGEIGHFPLLDNDIICRCGKVGCMETGASGSALHRMMLEKLHDGRMSSLSAIYKKRGDVELDEILGALVEEDMLAIECLGEIGDNLGRAIAGVINIFNPGLVVVGGRLIVGKDYLLLPIRTAVNKHSLSRVSSDSKIKLSTLERKAAGLGNCLLSRSKLIGLM